MSPLDCPHCTMVRAAQREVLDEFGLDSLPRWGQQSEVDAALRKSQMLALSADDGVCVCECHSIARMVGRRASGAAA